MNATALGSAFLTPNDAWFWPALLALVACSIASIAALSRVNTRRHPWMAAAPALAFGAWAIFYWQFLTQAFDVPRVILPAPSLILQSVLANRALLLGDFYETILKSALAGFVIGNGLGFAVGVAVDRSPFLQRGLTPLSALASTVPLVGVAPIMVMWFGFGWESKAAVVTIMTFFPMLVNTAAGLHASGRLERELLHSYAAGYWQTLVKLRLPAALPFVFNACKVNSVLALIGAIVAEFFGSPIRGMGFRISTEAAKMNMGLVWATILVAALAGSAIYAGLGWLERIFTFWHPSLRTRTP
jgi:NitT/TauT family transport system permease protein